MTIAIGCLCDDGLILGADTQLTAEGYHKDYRRKIHELDGDPVDAFVTYAGSPVFAQDFSDRILEGFCQLGDSDEPSDARDAVANILGRYVESDVRNNHMLVGVRIRMYIDF